jgi:hypothetical protein
LWRSREIEMTRKKSSNAGPKALVRVAVLQLQPASLPAVSGPVVPPADVVDPEDVAPPEEPPALDSVFPPDADDPPAPADAEDPPELETPPAPPAAPPA